MTTGSSGGSYGSRVLAIWRNKNDDRLLINVANPNTDAGDSGLYWSCTPGEWSTYRLEQRQYADMPHLTSGTIYIDGVKVHEFVADTKDILKEGTVKVFASSNFSVPADSFAIKNFSYQTFAERPYSEPALIPCSDARANCYEFIGSSAMVPRNNARISPKFAAHVNVEISVDIKCASMNADVYRNIVTISNDLGRGENGDRVFNIWQTIDEPGKILVNVADPSSNFNDSGFYFTCTEGEWNTYTLSQRQRSSNGDGTDIIFTVDDVVKHRRVVRTADVFKDGDLTVYVARHNPATAFEVKNFSYQFFDEV